MMSPENFSIVEPINLVSVTLSPQEDTGLVRTSFLLICLLPACKNLLICLLPAAMGTQMLASSAE